MNTRIAFTHSFSKIDKRSVRCQAILYSLWIKTFEKKKKKKKLPSWSLCFIEESELKIISKIDMLYGHIYAIDKQQKKAYSFGNVAFERKTWKKYINEQCTYWEKGPLDQQQSRIIAPKRSIYLQCISSVQSLSRVRLFTIPESQHTRTPCPSPTPGVYPNSCPLSPWCHPDISSSVVPFSSCPQSLPASGPFPMTQLFS